MIYGQRNINFLMAGSSGRGSQLKELCRKYYLPQILLTRRMWNFGKTNGGGLFLCVWPRRKAFKGATQKDGKLAVLIHQGRWDIQFKRQPSDEEIGELSNLLNSSGWCSTLRNEADCISCSSISDYTVKEILLARESENEGVSQPFKYRSICERSIFLRRFIYVWFVMQNAILIVDNLNKRGCEIAEVYCCFCNSMEDTGDHILLRCGKKLARKVCKLLPFANVLALWSERNKRLMAKKRGWTDHQMKQRDWFFSGDQIMPCFISCPWIS